MSLFQGFSWATGGPVDHAGERRLGVRLFNCRNLVYGSFIWCVIVCSASKNSKMNVCSDPTLKQRHVND